MGCVDYSWWYQNGFNFQKNRVLKTVCYNVPTKLVAELMGIGLEWGVSCGKMYSMPPKLLIWG